MTNRKDFFDAEFSDVIMDIRVSSLEDKIKSQNRFMSFILCLFALLIGTTFCLSGIWQDKLEKRIVALEQEIQHQDCRKEAESVGAGYAFIANGVETECYPLYSD